MRTESCVRTRRLTSNQTLMRVTIESPAGKSPAGESPASLPRARGALRELFGSVDLGHPTGADNEAKQFSSTE